MKRVTIIFTLIIISFLCLTGCGNKELRKVNLNETFRIGKNEKVSIEENTFTITRLGNATCDRNASGCVFDGLKVEYALTINDKTFDKTNINESPYNVKIGTTDYKNFAEVTITKKEG